MYICLNFIIENMQFYHSDWAEIYKNIGNNIKNCELDSNSIKITKLQRQEIMNIDFDFFSIDFL